MQLYVTTFAMFNAYGKLQSGLIRLQLQSPTSDLETRQNAGLLPPPRRSDPSEWEEDDPIWKASRILDQLERFEEIKVDPTPRVGTNKAFGEIQPVPWLDALAKEYCHNTLNEAREKARVCPSSPLMLNDRDLDTHLVFSNISCLGTLSPLPTW